MQLLVHKCVLQVSPLKVGYPSQSSCLESVCPYLYLHILITEQNPTGLIFLAALSDPVHYTLCSWIGSHPSV